MNANTINQLLPDTNRIGSRMGRLDPDIFRSQSRPKPEMEADETEENVFSDEAIDDEGNATDGSDYTKNDHQDNNNEPAV